jgi:methylated-DNA-[protein]-cysteine S-methyltransferase
MGVKTVRASESREGVHFFDTVLGRCALVWGPGGVRSVHLPETTERDTRERVLADHPAALEAEPPDGIRQAASAIAGLLRGGGDDLGEIPLDMANLPPFRRKVYEAARGIPAGRTRTYGELAADVGRPGAARAVGHAMSRNPYPLVVPCHRVVASDGTLGGFSAPGGLATKRRLLGIEAGGRGFD